MGDDKDVIDWLQKETEPIRLNRVNDHGNGRDYNEVDL